MPSTSSRQRGTSTNQSKLSSFFHPPREEESKAGSKKESPESSQTQPRVVKVAASTNIAGSRKRKGHASLMRDSENSRKSGFQQCVICNKYFPKHNLIQHASQCIGGVQEEAVQESNAIVIFDAGDNDNDDDDDDDDDYKETPYEFQNRILSNDHDDRVKNNAENKKEQGDDLNENHVGRREMERNGNHVITNKNVSSNGNHVKSCKELWKAILNNQPKKKITIPGTIPINTPIINPTSEPIPGLYLFENFITEEEEERIIHFLDTKTQWKHATFNGKHLGQRWGVHCNLRDRRVYPKETELPTFITDWILPKLRYLQCMVDCLPNEANAIDYYRKNGHYLKNHVDDRQLSKEAIANLSLAGDCLMTFRLERKNKNIKRYGTNYNHLPNEVKVLLPRRTLQVLTKCARYDYSHGITNKDLLSERRISVTMRQSPLTTSMSESKFKNSI